MMMIISSREFRDHLKKYFELVDQNEQIIVERGKDKACVIVPLNDADRLSVNEALIQIVQEAETEYVKHRTTRINLISGKLSGFFLNYLRHHIKGRVILNHLSIICPDTGPGELTRKTG